MEDVHPEKSRYLLLVMNTKKIRFGSSRHGRKQYCFFFLFFFFFFLRLHYYINILKEELSGTKAYKETSEEKMSVANGHCNHLALKVSANVKERKDRLPTMYWLPKIHKRPYKA